MESPLLTKATNKQEPKRKRGKRGGLRVKTRRRKSRPFLPVVVLGNVQSIRNKIGELQACAKYFFEYRESSVMCFSETWLNENDSEDRLGIEGFTIIRSDSTGESGKQNG